MISTFFDRWGEPVTGRWIILSSWATAVVFLVTAVPAALGVEAVDSVAFVTTLVLFLASFVVWCAAFGMALVRNVRGADIAVSTLFLVEGGAPAAARWNLYGALGLSLAVAVGTAVANPFGVMVPMLQLGLLGLWGAVHGQFPDRETPRPTTDGRNPGGRRGS